MPPKPPPLGQSRLRGSGGAGSSRTPWRSARDGGSGGSGSTSPDRDAFVVLVDVPPRTRMLLDREVGVAFVEDRCPRTPVLGVGSRASHPRRRSASRATRLWVLPSVGVGVDTGARASRSPRSAELMVVSDLVVDLDRLAGSPRRRCSSLIGDHGRRPGRRRGAPCSWARARARPGTDGEDPVGHGGVGLPVRNHELDAVACRAALVVSMDLILREGEGSSAGAGHQTHPLGRRSGRRRTERACPVTLARPSTRRRKGLPTTFRGSRTCRLPGLSLRIGLGPRSGPPLDRSWPAHSCPPEEGGSAPNWTWCGGSQASPRSRVAAASFDRPRRSGGSRCSDRALPEPGPPRISGADGWGLGFFSEEPLGGHDHARRAVAALARRRGPPSEAWSGWSSVAALDPFDGLDLAAFASRRPSSQARQDGFARRRGPRRLPHSPSSQPCLVPVSPHSSRSTSSRV